MMRASEFYAPVSNMLFDTIKTIPQYIIPKHALTYFAGFMADIHSPRIKNYLIRRFIRNYNVNMNEALEENPENYPCFNDFFIRNLKPGCRPIASADLVSPVDGRISEMGKIHHGTLLQAKNRHYHVNDLLASDESLSNPFINGHFITLYLSPKDYHRVHMPIQGALDQMIHIPGILFSVQPSTARVIPQLFARNERLVLFFNTKAGLMAVVMVGATIVGSIGTTWHGDIIRTKNKQFIDYTQNKTKPIQLQQGAELGYFKLGSTVILLFEKDFPIQWSKNTQTGRSIQLGQALAQIQP